MGIGLSNKDIIEFLTHQERWECQIHLNWFSEIIKKCTINISFYRGRFMFIAVLILPIIVCLPVLINYIVCLLRHSDIYDPN